MSRTATAARPVREATPGGRRSLREAETAARRFPWRSWAGPFGVLLLAAVTRLWAIGSPRVLVFDETYYVKDAWTLVHLGYEGKWPADADAAFQAGRVDSYLPGAAYVAHPPLGKWIIGLGELVTGAANPVGWRLSVAVVGVLAVALVMLVTHRMFGTPLVTVVAGGLFAIDNQAIVMSRVALLDNIVMFFGLAAFACLLEDRFWTERRLGLWLMRRRREIGGWGPTLVWRPWLLATGVLLGLCTAVKWSGVYFIAAFAVYTVGVDMMLRRRAGIPLWYGAGLLKQLPVTVLNLIPTALLAYLAGWTGWFVTSGGWDRHYVEDGGTRFTGALAWVPVPLQNLWAWHADIYGFHVGLSSPHPYSTPAVLWPLIARPTSMYWDASSGAGSGCQWGSCASAITDIPNPLIWYAGIAAAIYLFVRLIRRHEWQAGLLLMGVAGGYLPWLLFPRRTMFFFYSIAFEPYLLIGLAAVIGLMVLRPGAVDSPDEVLAAEARYGMKVRRGIVIGFLGLAVLISAFFYPMDTGMQTSYWFWHLHMWSPTWV